MKRRILAYGAIIALIAVAAVLASIHTPTSYATNPYAVGGILKPAKVAAPGHSTTAIVVGLVAAAAVIAGALVAYKTQG